MVPVVQTSVLLGTKLVCELSPQVTKPVNDSTVLSGPKFDARSMKIARSSTAGNETGAGVSYASRGSAQRPEMFASAFDWSSRTSPSSTTRVSAGLHVVGVRRSPLAEGDPVDEMVTPAALLDVLPRADWLALACPLTEETRGVVSAAAIAAMPRGARILNVARGEVVDQEAMIAALRDGRLGGAYLDVTSPEPLPPESPLWELPNVIISPHNSAVAEGNERRQVDMFLANLRRWGRGEPMMNAAN